ncbi:LysE family translocator [Litoribrevibacter albus]|uniref:Threonine transporter RhtB n=1 Tax=Litoribrevibacter albus TaxID=1473156 RepID=A0AA37W9I5_9GAMM|nr:LysE family translocator [Litoribrevibacter albus]GLQ33538.1 threonine transporter RhtB [Litoribrevibacter albus]
MTLLSLLALAGTMLLLAAMPGPGVFATVARALSSGFGHASVVVLGIVSGDLVFLLMAVFGLAVMAEALGSFFTIVKYVGAAYLIWLGIKLWRTKPEAVNIDGVKENSWMANYLSGLFITLSNPKVIIFYLGMLPTFVNLTDLGAMDVFLVATVISVVLGCVMLGYAYLASKARKAFQNPDAEKRMNRIGGGIMVATGSVLATKG